MYFNYLHKNSKKLQASRGFASAEKMGFRTLRVNILNENYITN